VVGLNGNPCKEMLHVKLSKLEDSLRKISSPQKDLSVVVKDLPYLC